MLKSLQIMQFCLQTGFGKSTQTYGGSEDNPLAGAGQGNGGAPPSFTALSTLVVNAYKRLGHGATLTSSLMARIYLLASVLYVDDGDWLHTADEPTTSDEDMLKKVQLATTDFGQLAQATGGALKQEKCSAYFLLYRFPSGVPRLKSVSEFPAPIAEVTRKDGTTAPAHITVPQPNGNELPIDTLDVSTPAKLLGVYFRPGGDSEPHISEMRNKGLDWVD